jgi:hypothetical protein
MMLDNNALVLPLLLLQENKLFLKIVFFKIKKLYNITFKAFNIKNSHLYFSVTF